MVIKVRPLTDLLKDLEAPSTRKSTDFEFVEVDGFLWFQPKCRGKK